MTAPDFRFYINAAEALVDELPVDPGEPLSESATRDVITIILLASAAVESLVNGMLEDYAAVQGKFETHERAFMLEQELAFCESGSHAGQFTLAGRRYRPLEHKVLFLLQRIGRHTVDRGSRLWQRFRALKDTRDAVVHPRQSRELALTPAVALDGIGAAKNVILLLGEHVWHKTLRF